MIWRRIGRLNVKQAYNMTKTGTLNENQGCGLLLSALTARINSLAESNIRRSGN
jgi:hypothetical protein